MSRQHIVFLVMGVVAAGCGRTQSSPRPLTGLDAQAVVEPSGGADAMVVVDSGVVVDAANSMDAASAVDAAVVVDVSVDTTESYPQVDGGDGFRVIDPTYAQRNFKTLLEGTWLVGFYGGQNHFSWIRFSPAGDKATDGTTDVLAKATVPYNQAYWGCSGQGRWDLAAQESTVSLTMPAGCSGETLHFDSFRVVSDPAGAMLEAKISACSGSDCGTARVTKLVGMKFSDSYCDAAFTVCGSPF